MEKSSYGAYREVPREYKSAAKSRGFRTPYINLSAMIGKCRREAMEVSDAGRFVRSGTFTSDKEAILTLRFKTLARVQQAPTSTHPQNPVSFLLAFVKIFRLARGG